MIAASVIMWNSRRTLRESDSPQANAGVPKVSRHRPHVCENSWKPPASRPLLTSTPAWPPPASPAISTSVLAVASGNGNSPCISLTKKRRNGIRNRMPRKPPSREARHICMKFVLSDRFRM